MDSNPISSKPRSASKFSRRIIRRLLIILAATALLVTAGIILTKHVFEPPPVPYANLRAISPDGVELWRKQIEYPVYGPILVGSVIAVDSEHGRLAFDAVGVPQPAPEGDYSSLYCSNYPQEGKTWQHDVVNISHRDGEDAVCTVTNPYTLVDYTFDFEKITAAKDGDILWESPCAVPFDHYEVFFNNSDRIVLTAHQNGENIFSVDGQGQQSEMLHDENAIAFHHLLPDGRIVCSLLKASVIVCLDRDCTELWRVDMPEFNCLCHTAYGIAATDDGMVYYFGQYCMGR